MEVGLACKKRSLATKSYRCSQTVRQINLAPCSTTMPIVSHNDLPIHQVPRIKTRVLVGGKISADETSVWEQWLENAGFIPLHYHTVEETLVILQGTIALTIEENTIDVEAPSTIVIPANQLHGLRSIGSNTVHLLAFFPTANPQIIAADGSLRPMPWEDLQGGTPPP